MYIYVLYNYFIHIQLLSLGASFMLMVCSYHICCQFESFGTCSFWSRGDVLFLARWPAGAHRSAVCSEPHECNFQID